jgi:hypothetical protein
MLFIIGKKHPKQCWKKKFLNKIEKIILNQLGS